MSDLELKQAEAGELLRVLLDINEKLKAAKALYVEQEKLTLELQRRGFEHAVLPEGLEARLIDNFASSNTCFRPAGVKRFEISFESAEKAAKKRAKAVQDE